MSASKQTEDGEGTGPKVLRIGIVQKGKIVDERELKKRETVSLGTHEKAMFSVASDALPKSFDLFDYDGKDYFLRFSSGMEGRIQLDGTSAADFNQLKQQNKIIKRADSDAVKLTDASRGKVVIGDITVLFQFKALQSSPAIPVLPAEIKGSLLQNIDGQFTAIFVLVAIFEISLVAYARNQPYIEPTSIEQIDQSFQRLIMPDRAPEPPKEELAEAGAEKGKDENKEKPKDENKDTGKKAKAKDTGPVDAEAAARARKEAISKAVAGKGLLKVLGSNGKSDGALNDVFAEGGGAVGSLGDAFSGIQGVDIASSGGQTGTRGGGSGTGVGIGDLSTEGGGSVNSGTKTETAVRGDARAEAPEVDGELSQAEISGVMKRNLKALRDCYESALKRDRTLSGKVVIRFEILEDGRTANIEFEDSSLKSADVVSCIKGRAKYWRFPKPEGGSVFVAYPIVFTPAG